MQDLVREVAYQTLSHGEHRRCTSLPHDISSRAPKTSWRSSSQAICSRRTGWRPTTLMRGRSADARWRRCDQRLGRRCGCAFRNALRGFGAALRLCDGPEQRAVVLEETATAARAAARLDLAEGLREFVRGRGETGQRNEAAMARAQLASVMLLAQHNEAAIPELDGPFAPSLVRPQRGRSRLRHSWHRHACWSGTIGRPRVGRARLEAARRLGLDTVSADLLVTPARPVHLSDEEADWQICSAPSPTPNRPAPCTRSSSAE